MVAADPGVSVVTIVRSRRRQLGNLIEGLSRQTLTPKELVVGFMEEDLPDETFAEIGCPIRRVHVPGDPLPLARARNSAAAAASGDVLVFLDVDCIPEPGLVQSYADAVRRAFGVFLGEVFYLPGGVPGERLDFDELSRVGVPHPSKPPIPSEGIAPEKNAGELWGLSFALSHDLWRQLGGMDEAFVGYGGEETDFAARLEASDVPLYWTANARAYHQHHPVLVPPLHHFAAIVANARRFHRKHGRWCMDYWLGQFERAGYVEWSADDLTVIRTPQPAEIEAARQPDDVRFS